MMSRNTNNHHDSCVCRRAYANPTEDQAIANIMREEARRKRLERRQRAKARRSNDRIYRPGGVWHAEE